MKRFFITWIYVMVGITGGFWLNDHFDEWRYQHEFQRGLAEGVKAISGESLLFKVLAGPVFMTGNGHSISNCVFITLCTNRITGVSINATSNSFIANSFATGSRECIHGSTNQIPIVFEITVTNQTTL